MSINSRTKRWIAGGMGVLALSGGGVALAQHQAAPPSMAASAASAADVPGPGDTPDTAVAGTKLASAVDRPEPGDTPDGAVAASRTTTADVPEPGDTPDAAQGAGDVGALPHGASSVQAPTASDAAETPGAEQTGAAETAAERNESATLATLARVDKSAAEAAATAHTPGTVVESQLGNEDGNVVWEVTVRSHDGAHHELKVDAGTAKVLQVSMDQVD